MQFASALSTEPLTSRAVEEVCQEALAQLGGNPDLAMVFVSPHHGPDLAPLAERIAALTDAGCLMGCSGEAIVGTAREVESEPAISLWLARMPGVSVKQMHLEYAETPEGGSLVGWPDDLPAEWPAGALLLVLAEPYSFPADLLLKRLDEDQPQAVVAGGMASGGAAPGENQLILGRRSISEGAVATLVYGRLRVRTVVSQGCRPIGRPLVVTKAHQNVIEQLSGRPAFAQLEELFGELSRRDRELVQQGLHVGRVINEYQDHFERGDFLVRNVIGADPKSGAIAIGDFIRPGQTVQFHVRDAASADEDLAELLTSARRGAGSDPRGALLFTCNGRGTRLFHRPSHDAAALADAFGPLPVSGFFAQGEIGPIGGHNFLHGFTASIALFEPRDEPADA